MGYGITISYVDGKLQVTSGKFEKPKREHKGISIIDFPKEFTIIDIETTGFDSLFDSIIEVAALKVKDGEVIDTFQSLIFNNIPLDSFIVDLTGITSEMLLNAPQIEEVLNKFIEFIGNSILVGHNVHFDINFLYDNIDRFLDKHLSNDFIDTLRIARRILPQLSHHRLDDLCDFYKIPLREKHRSLNDCYKTFDVYNELFKDIHDIESFKASYKGKSNPSVRSKDIKPTTIEIDESHPLYNKVCVFTGALEKMHRKDAMQIVANIGGINGDNVTKKTNYLILGNTDYCSNIKNGKSNKQRKAEELKLKGQDIEVISENVFYDMIFTD